jgi:carboxyl-terminal processing protease
VPLDTIPLTDLHTELLRTGVLREFAIDFASNKREILDQFADAKQFDVGFKLSAKDFQALLDFARQNDVKATGSFLSEAELVNNLKALIARSVWNGDGFYPIINKEDAMVKVAIEELTN